MDVVKLSKPKLYVDLVVAFGLAVISLPPFLGLHVAPPADSVFRWWMPMQINTAGAILALAAAIAGAALRRDKIANAFGVVVSLIGVVTLLQYLTGVNFGVDQILRKNVTSCYLGHFGRMPPQSAISFAAAGLSFFALTQPKLRHVVILSASGVLGFVPLALGLLCAAGFYLFDQGQNPTDFSLMSLPTALALILSGAWLLVRTVQTFARSRRDWVRLVPFAGSVVVGGLVLFVWHFMVLRDLRYTRATVAATCEKAITETKQTLEQTTLALSRYASRLEYLGVKDTAFLELDAKNYLQQIPVLARIGLTDARYRVVWSYPAALRDQVAGFDQSREFDRREAFLATLKEKKPVLSHSIALRSGTPGHILPIPLYRRGKFQGFVYGTLQTDKLFSRIANDEMYRISVYEKGIAVFESGNSEDALAYSEHPGDLQWGLASWKFTLAPTNAFMVQHSSKAPYYFLLMGLSLALMLAAYLQTIANSREVAGLYSEAQEKLTQRLHIALLSANMGAWSIDLRTGIVWRSETHDQIFGFPSRQEHWDQQTFIDLVVEEDRPQVLEGQRRAIESAKPEQIEFRIRRPGTGELRWLKILSLTVRDAAGKPVEANGIVSDQTREIIQREEHLAALKWRKAVLNSTHYSVISTDCEGIIRTFNAAAEKMVGHTALEVIDRFSPALIHDKDEVVKRASALSEELGETVVPGFGSFIAKVKKLRVPDENEWTYIHKNGSRIPVRLTVTHLEDSAGNITGYLGVAMDLSAEKKSKEELSIASDRLARVIEATGQGIWERELLTQKVLFANGEGKKIFGFPPDQPVTHEQLASRVFPEDAEKLGLAIKEHVARQTPFFTAELRLKLPPGNPQPVRWIRTRGRIETIEGKNPRVLSTFNDVTDEIDRNLKLEEALVKAQAGMQAKSNFLASMSHEIRTPLNGIIGMTDILLESPLTPEQRNYAKIAQQSGTALLTLVNDILDFSKIEAGKLELEVAPFDLVTLIETQVDLLIGKAKEKKLSLNTVIPRDVSRSFEGDSGRIGQILLNLIGNSIKFTNKGGVSVRVFEMPMENRSVDRARLKFEVEDSGIGIDPGNVDKLFEPFVQAEVTIANRFGGTGLGLSICRRLVRAMGGEIGVESKKGRGSVFWFTLDLKLSRHERENARHLGWDEIRGVPVLLVDENPLARESLRQYISSFELEPAVAENADQALALYRSAEASSRPYPLVIIAGGPGGAFGETVLARLREHGPATKVCAIYLHDITDLQNFRKIPEGFFSALRTPVRQSQLLDAIVNALHGQVSPVSEVETPRRAEPQRKKERILIADDNPVNQLLSVTMVESMGYSAIAVANGREAIEAIQAVHYDLILMDCQMPEMDGFEATRQIRKHEDKELRNIPIVALTANALRGDDKICLAAGMNDYLSKPIKKEILQRMIEKWLPATDVKIAA